MDFFNKLGKKASETYQATKEKASNLSEELKLKGKITDLEEKIRDKYTEIGEIVYNELKEGKDVSRDEVNAKCEEISKYKDDISKLKVDLLAVKKIKKCSNCGAELSLEAEFCSKCGKEQPKMEKVNIEKEPENMAETEVIEVNNVNNENPQEENNN